MQTIINKIKEFKKPITITFKSGNEITINTNLYNIDTETYIGIIFFSNDCENIYIRCSDISMIKCHLKTMADYH